jgi:PKD repeat protein
MMAIRVKLAAVAISSAFAVGCMTVAANSSDLTASRVTGTAPLAVQFTIGGRPGRYKVDFGDGSSLASVDTILSQPWISHSYAAPGMYTAKLLMTADGGADIHLQAVATVTITVTRFP